MNNPLISVIIPVYNLEKYLPKCLNSVLAQTYKNFEIIPVDDGSKDGSTEILKEYSQKDTRIKPVFKENGGVSSARNAGLDNSSGEYIFFLDGDDWIAPTTLEKLLDTDRNFDVVQAAYINSYADGTEEAPIVSEYNEFYSQDDILGAYFLNKIQESCCNKLYKKSVIGDTRFDSKMAVAEDSKFTYSILKKSDKVKLLTDITYHYFCREDSCTHESLKEKHFAPLELRDLQYREICDNKELLKKFVFLYSKLVFYLIREILLDKNKNFKDRLPLLRNRILKKKHLILFSKYLSLKFKIGVIILWLCPSLFYKIYSR